jgi:hypothetical protein
LGAASIDQSTNCSTTLNNLFKHSTNQLQYFFAFISNTQKLQILDWLLPTLAQLLANP